VQGVDLAQRLAYRGFGFQQRQVVPLGSEGSNFPSFGHLGPGSGRSTYRVTERIERPGQAPVRTEKQIQVHDLDLKTTLEGLYPLVLLGGLPRSIPLEVTFNRQGEGGSLRSLFRREPTVGDPLFDPVVFVDARRSAKLSALLSAEGLQSVIMEVVGGRGSVSIKGNAVRIHYEVLRWEDLPPEGEARRNLALVMHYCDLYCQHLERPQEMAWPPSTF
jgi:hypothetical protein